MSKYYGYRKLYFASVAPGAGVRRATPPAFGFSLIETLVVIAIVAIAMAIAIPSFGSMMQKNRLSSAASALQVSLSLARSEAIKRGIDSRVTVTANTTAGVWTNGWTVFLDRTTTANNGVSPPASTDCSLSTTTACPLEVVAAPTGPVSTSQTSSFNYFTYNGQGRLVDVNGGYANRSFWFFDGSSDKYCLVVNSSGRVRTEVVASATACSTS
jgi:type IV fimbrial biogenesis protein FimT